MYSFALESHIVLELYIYCPEHKSISSSRRSLYKYKQQFIYHSIKWHFESESFELIRNSVSNLHGQINMDMDTYGQIHAIIHHRIRHHEQRFYALIKNAITRLRFLQFIL